MGIGLMGCTQGTSTEKSMIVTTIPPLQYIAQEIAGEDYMVYSLLSPIDSPHTATLQPSDIQRLNAASLIILNGEVDAGLAERIEHLETEHREILRTSDLFEEEDEPEETEDEEHHENEHSGEEEEGHEEETHEHEHSHDGDSHHWMSIEQALTIGEAVQQRLAQEHPEQKDMFKNNYDHWTTTMSAIQEEQKQAGIVPGPFLDMHDAYGHLYEDLGIDEYHRGSISHTHGDQLGPQELQELITMIKEESIAVIFTEGAFENPYLEELKRTFPDLKIVPLYPMGTEKEDTLQDILHLNMELIQDAFR